MLRGFLLILLLLAGSAQANDWDALRAPGAVAIMRHALAPGIGDPANFNLDDCTTQRTLDARGQDQARRIGQELRARGILFDKVLTSQWCRSRATARLLGVGPVKDAPPLNSFFRDPSNRDRHTRETLDLIGQTDGRLMLVTHQVNISALTGQGAGSGEIVVFRLIDGTPQVTGRILIAP